MINQINGLLVRINEFSVYSNLNRFGTQNKMDNNWFS